MPTINIPTCEHSMNKYAKYFCGIKNILHHNCKNNFSIKKEGLLSINYFQKRNQTGKCQYFLRYFYTFLSKLQNIFALLRFF